MTDPPTPPTSDPADGYVSAGDVLEGIDSSLQAVEGLLGQLDRFEPSEGVRQARDRAEALLYGLRFQVAVLGRALRGDPARVPLDDALLSGAVSALDALRAPDLATMAGRAHKASQSLIAALCHLVHVEMASKGDTGP